MTSVFYTTFYGSTRQYAEALAGRLGTVARELPATLDATGGPVVVLSPVHGPCTRACASSNHCRRLTVRWLWSRWA